MRQPGSAPNHRAPPSRTYSKFIKIHQQIETFEATLNSDSAIINSSPMLFSLPFDFNSASISSWLNQLNPSDAVLAGYDIFNVLKILRREIKTVDINSLELLVAHLTPVVLSISGILEKAYFNKGDNLNTQQCKIVRLNTVILSNLAFLHIHLIKQDTEQKKKTLHGTYSVHLIGMALYQYALAYEQENSSLWDMAGEVYTLALTDNLLEKIVDKPLKACGKLPAIGFVLKRNLLFSLENHHKFSHQELKSYFDFCSSHYQCVEFNQLGVKTEQGFCWQYETGEKPFPVTSKSETKISSDLILAAIGKKKQSRLIFNIEPLLAGIKNFDINVPFDASLRVIEHLSNYREIKETKFALPSHYIFVFSFEVITEFLSRLDRKNARYTFKPPSVDDLNFSSLDLAPILKEKPQNVNSSDIWGRREENIVLKYGAKKTFKTTLPGFLTVEWMIVAVASNGLILMYDKNMKISIAVVRRLEEKESHSNVQNGIIEVLDGSVSVEEIKIGNVQDKAVLLTQKESHELILSEGKYMTGTSIKLKQGTLVLDRLLENTNYFVRYAVSLK